MARGQRKPEIVANPAGGCSGGPGADRVDGARAMGVTEAASASCARAGRRRPRGTSCRRYASNAAARDRTCCSFRAAISRRSCSGAGSRGSVGRSRASAARCCWRPPRWWSSPRSATASTASAAGEVASFVGRGDLSEDRLLLEVN